MKFTLLSDTDRTVIEAYDIWKEKKLYGKTSMGVVRTTYTLALKQMGITVDTPTPNGGVIGKDENGELKGSVDAAHLVDFILCVGEDKSITVQYNPKDVSF